MIKGLIIAIVGLLVTTVSNGQQPGVIGVDIRSANPYWKNYDSKIQDQRLEKIRRAIIRNLGNLTLLEYSFVLDQLCELLRSDSMKIKWTDHVSNLNKKDALMQLSADFFKSTLEVNSYLRDNHLASYNYIKQSLNVFPSFPLNDSRLDSLLLQVGFSEVVGEAKIFDFLIIDSKSTLRVISSDSKLLLRYETWLGNLNDDAYGFWFSDNRPSEMFVRESGFLIKRLTDINSSLSIKSASAVDEIKIVRIHPNKNGYPLGYPDNPTDPDLLIGTWFGPYTENKKIIIQILKVDGKKIFARSKMSGQDDTQFVLCEGDYSEIDKKFKLILNEPEKEKPFNGTFELTIDRFSLEMRGRWNSYNKQISRNFKIQKNPLMPDR